MNPRPTFRPGRQAGAALLAAMLTVTLVATFAAAALWQQWRATEVESAERARVQASWVLIGALDWSRLILREDGRSGETDNLTEPWAVPLEEARLSSFLDLAHVVKVSEEDLEALDGSLSIEQHAAAILARPSCELVVVTLGEKGSRAFTASGEATAAIYAPPVFGDTVGAGDSLMAGILSWLDERGLLKPGKLDSLGNGALSDMLRFGAVVAGINCGRKGCKPPTRAEVDAVLMG